MQRASVDLPDPDSPARPTISPAMNYPDLTLMQHGGGAACRCPKCLTEISRRAAAYSCVLPAYCAANNGRHGAASTTGGGCCVQIGMACAQRSANAQAGWRKAQVGRAAFQRQPIGRCCVWHWQCSEQRAGVGMGRTCRVRWMWYWRFQ
jgi:hypothetical protein